MKREHKLKRPISRATIDKINAVVLEYRLGFVRSADFILISAPDAPRGYILKQRSQLPKIPNN